ncbi:aldehyde ferredoxin oxidoreductase family protein [Thermococcus sp. LS2]|uniref:aldehyde ferredoxin oxidoreductase family protein n=1 Tax=Thermococcus sp. LS2 TaxID=1638260 RepID=UPI00143961A2|nr:aldehyde ferredoxin oxidoreductase family protein [Thermococcus sp. LS2]
MVVTYKIAEINLTKNKVTERELSKSEITKFIGGVGIGAKILWEETDEYVHPFSPGNPLIFMTGPLTGTPIPASGKHAVITKSPLTGLIGESIAGGFWGSELRKAGFMGVVITGKARKPIYLWIHDGKVEFRDASDFWGLDTYEADRELRKETDKNAKVATIGPAGENMVLISSIIHEPNPDVRGGVAARCGVGAVMGSKRLKAVVVRGDDTPYVVDEDKLRESVLPVIPDIKNKTKALSKYGTAGLVLLCSELGDLPTKNWTQGSWDKAEKISGEELIKFTTKKYGCYGCPIACGHKVFLKDDKYGKVDGKCPEYETLAALGSLCLNDDLKAIIKANELCDRYGLDTISVGATIAFAMEASEKGILKEKIEWGDSDAIINLIDAIAYKKGIGRLLSQGVYRASKELGPLSEEFAVHVKKLEPTMHDPRAYASVALGYATGNRGPCHLQAFSHPLERNVSMPELGYPKPLDRFSLDGKAEMVIKMQNLMSVFDSLVICKFLIFGGVGPKLLAEWLTYVTGFDFDTKTVMIAGERIFNLKRMINVREGISRKDDILHPRLLTCKTGRGTRGFLPHLGKLLSEYYELRGWTETGIPKQEKLKELELDTIVYKSTRSNL